MSVKVDGTVDSPVFDALARDKYGILGLPTVVFVDPHGREAPHRVLGLVSPEEMIDSLRAVDRACEREGPPPPKSRAGAGPAVAMACAARW